MDDKREHKDFALDSSYLSYKSRRPQLFPQRSSSAQMVDYPTALKPLPTMSLQEPNNTFAMAAIASGQENTVQLSQSKHDGCLTKSIISRAKAQSTRGTIKSVPAETLCSADGKTYATNSCITLRCHYQHALKSFSETFYIVDACIPYDAILRRDTEKPALSNIPQAYPMFIKESKDDKVRKRALEEKKLRELQRQKQDIKQRTENKVEQQLAERRARRT